MSNLPPLTANAKFINDLLDARAPCFAIGMIEEANQKLGLLALRPGEVIAHEVMERGFNFGHSLIGNDQYQVVQFAFEFYGFGTYNVLLNPNNPLVRAVLDSMIHTGEYFFLAIGPDHDVTAFRSEIGQDKLTGLKDNRQSRPHPTFNHKPGAVPKCPTLIPKTSIPTGPIAHLGLPGRYRLSRSLH